jgi:4-hydroxybenzoate polyprenyltransferase
MRSERRKRPILTTTAEVAKALGIAILSLALGTAFCLCLLLGGTALAAG